MKIYQLDHIETPRLIIRPIKSRDEIEINTAINRSLPSLQEWMPWAKDPSLEATQDFVDRAICQWKSGNATEWPMVVIHKDTNKIIAATGFNDRSVPVIPFYEIGYWIDSAYQGQGFVAEYVNALARYALEVLGAQRMQICTHVENQKSIAVAERCGFTFEATMKNERSNCENGLPANSALYACCDMRDLPPLNVTWKHHKKVCHTQTEILKPKPSASPIKLESLESNCLKLIPPKKRDAATLHSALMASLHEVGPYFSWATPMLTLENMSFHIKEGIEAANDIKAHSHLFYLVWNKKTHAFLGEVWLKVLDWSVMSAYVAYWFDSRHTGQGYATEAVARVIQYAFEKLNAKRIAIDISTHNPSSLKLPKRLHFKSEAILKNHYRNFITNEISDAKRFVITDISQLNSTYSGLKQ